MDDILANIGLDDTRIVPWTDDITLGVAHLLATRHDIMLKYIHSIDLISFGQDNPYDVMLQMIKKRLDKNPERVPDMSLITDDVREYYGERGGYGSMVSQAYQVYEYNVDIVSSEDLEEKLRSFLSAHCMEAQLMKALSDVQKARKKGRQFDFNDIYTGLRNVGDMLSGQEEIYDYFSTCRERIYSRMQNEDGFKKFPVGFEGIDKALEGGLGIGEIGIFLADTGVGKSQMLANVAYSNIMQGNNVYFISAENLPDVVNRRFDARFADISMNDLSRNLENVIANIDSIRSIDAGRMGRLKIICYPMGSASIFEMRADLERFMIKESQGAGFKPDVVILDYLDEVKGEISGQDEYSAQGMTTRDFRQWMQELKAAGFTATQANRSASDMPIINRSQMGNSYKKVQKADCLWTMNCQYEEDARGVMRLFVDKHRNSKSKFIVHLSADFSKCQFRQISVEEYNRRMNSNV